MKTKNPFRGIAHSNGSSYNQRYFRHIEGARDESPTWRNRDTAMKEITYRNTNPTPVLFCE